MATNKEHDFGFSFFDESEIDQHAENVAAQAVNEVQLTYKERLQKVEDLILPFLNNLTKQPEKVMIKWPNRKEVVEMQIQKLLEITRD